MTTWRLVVFLMLLSFSVFASEEAHEEDEAASFVTMPAAERAAKGIETALARTRLLTAVVNAPGEVRVNLYRTAQVTPRIAAQVVQRHAKLGDLVAKQQRLVTLSSVAMADAQGELIEADREWRRVKKLGRKVVSEKRYVSAQVARQRAYATVLAYGMSRREVDDLLASADAAMATGEFDLLSPRPGRIIYDEFVLGEVVETGKLLFEITDESVVWVEARLRPEDAGNIVKGSVARVSMDGQHWLQGKVIQLHHRLDAGSRTLAVRIEVNNENGKLHPGQYVQASLQTQASKARVAVPEQAVVLLQGSPTVFRVEGDRLIPTPVETGVSSAGWVEIVSGLAAGEEIAVKGVFILKSLLLKSQIGDEH